MHKLRFTIGAVFVLLALLLGACGGDGPQAGQGSVSTQVIESSEPTTAPEAPTDTPAEPTGPALEATAAPTTAAAAQANPTLAPTTVVVEPTTAPTDGGGAKAAQATATKAPSPKPRSTKAPTATATPEPTPAPVAAKPVRLRINTPEVKVDAAVEHVGKTPEGAMDVPKAWENVAWFEPGYEPGELGNSVIAGHFDSETGPAVFYEAKKLKVGDVLEVEDERGKVTKFRVRKVELFDAASAPIYEIFGPSDEAHLNLITCDGTFDREVGQYDKRLVVFSDKIEG